MRSLAKIVGANIRRERKSRGLSREQLAHLSGVSVRTVQQCERGEHEATIATLTWIAGALGVRRGMLMEAP